MSFTNSLSLLKLMSIELVIPSNHLISVAPFSSCLQSFPASGYFQMIWVKLRMLFICCKQTPGSVMTTAWLGLAAVRAPFPGRGEQPESQAWGLPQVEVTLKPGVRGAAVHRTRGEAWGARGRLLLHRCCVSPQGHSKAARAAQARPQF